MSPFAQVVRDLYLRQTRESSVFNARMNSASNALASVFSTVTYAWDMFVVRSQNKPSFAMYTLLRIKTNLVK